MPIIDHADLGWAPARQRVRERYLVSNDPRKGVPQDWSVVYRCGSWEIDSKPPYRDDERSRSENALTA